MYTANLKNLFDLFENDLPTWKSSITKYNETINYEAGETEDGKMEITIDVLGHNPKNIKLEVTEDKLSIKAKKEEDVPALVKDIDLSFTIGKDYDGTKTKAQFSNGLLTLTIDKKEERKAKSIEIKVG